MEGLRVNALRRPQKDGPGSDGPGSDLDVLQPVVGVRRAGQSEVVFRSHPGLQGLHLGRGSVRGHVADQVTTESVGQEVEVNRHRVAHGHVPEEKTKKKYTFYTNDRDLHGWIGL